MKSSHLISITDFNKNTTFSCCSNTEAMFLNGSELELKKSGDNGVESLLEKVIMMSSQLTADDMHH